MIQFDIYKYKLAHKEACLIYRDKPEEQRKSGLIIPKTVSDEHQHASLNGFVVQMSEGFKAVHPAVRLGDVISFNLYAPNKVFANVDTIEDAKNYYIMHAMDVLGAIEFEALDEDSQALCLEILAKWGVKPAS